MKIDAWTYSEGLKSAKRIYSNAMFNWSCPECKITVESKFNQVPLISYGAYCHVFYCESCGYESESKMYELNQINHDSVDITPSGKYGLFVK